MLPTPLSERTADADLGTFFRCRGEEDVLCAKVAICGDETAAIAFALLALKARLRAEALAGPEIEAGRARGEALAHDRGDS